MKAPEGTAHIQTEESVAPAKMMLPLGCQLIHFFLDLEREKGMQ